MQSGHKLETSRRPGAYTENPGAEPEVDNDIDNDRQLGDITRCKSCEWHDIGKHIDFHVTTFNCEYNILFMQKTYQFINAVKDVSRSHKKANTFL